MSSNIGDGPSSLESRASSETLVSIAQSATTISDETLCSMEPGLGEGIIRTESRLSETELGDAHYSEWTNLTRFGKYDLSHRTNWEAFRRNVLQHHISPRNMRFENQDALPPQPRWTPVPPKLTVHRSPRKTNMGCVAMTVSSVYAPEKEPLLHKIVVLGDKGVGKRAFTIQFTMKQFVRLLHDLHPQKVENYYHSPAAIDGISYMIGLMDTSGMEEDAVLLEQKIRDGEAFVLMYRVHSRSSFNRIEAFYEQICKVKGGDRNLVIIVGNASNERGKDFDGVKIEVSQADAHSLATELGFGVVEVSVRKWIDVKEVVFGLVKDLTAANALPSLS